MSREKPFYIGWSDQVDPRITLFYRNIRWYFLGVLMVLSALVVLFQKSFNDHQFESGHFTKITGRYYSDPFPILVPDENVISRDRSHGILLVGNGKRGAEKVMQDVSVNQGDLNGKRITLSGTLIYGDGKILLELTDQENSVRKIFPDIPEIGRIQARSPVVLTGEIVDPKCYFGVMKPGAGKTHKSCAIRCISGGIPPVFRHETGRDEHPFAYYLMLDNNSSKINQKILPFVGERLNVVGNAANFMGWDIVYVDVSELK